MTHSRAGNAAGVAGLIAALITGCGGGAGGDTSSSPASSSPAHVSPSVTTTAGSGAGAGSAKGGSIIHAGTKVAATVDGRVGYRVVGHGPPLVMIMGFAGTMDAWEPAFVDSLARTHRVVVLDNAGVGATSTLPSPLTITAMAEQTAALLATLHLGPTAVLGWSMGGLIAQSLAVTHPALVKDLVLCATLPGDGRATLPTAAVSAQLAEAAVQPTALLALLFPAGQAAAEQTYVSGITSYPGFYLPSAAVEAQQGLALVSWTSGQEPAGRDVSGLKVPTLVADGTEDVLAPEANSHTLGATIPGAQLVLYPGAGHAFLFQDSTEFVARVDTFLG